MARAIIAHPRSLDLATITGAVGAWRETQTVSLANLQDMQPGLLARTTNATTNTYIVIQFSAAVAANTAALIATNLSASANIRIRGATSEANLTAAPGYDSGSISAWPGTGRPTDAGLTAWNVFKTLSNSTAYVWWRIDFDDTGNADGYIQLARPILAPGEQTALTTSRDFQRAPADVVIDSPFGPTRTQARLKPRTFTLEFQWLTEAEMWAGLADIDRLRGRAGDLVICLDPDATSLLHHYTLHGLIRDIIPFSNPRYGIFVAKAMFKELV